MRAFRFLNLAILSILVASSAVLYAQDEKPQEEKPPKQEEPKGQEEAKPASSKDDMKPPKQDEAKPPKQDKQEQKRDEKQPAQQMNNGQMNNGRQEPAQQQGYARPAGKSAHIPDDKFRAQFGRGHVFKVQRPVTVEGGQGFVYGGYSFVIVDAWPPDWAYTDDCYVDYIDGEYFLFDMFHPGVRIALMVVM
jgi:hypothetical protein